MKERKPIRVILISGFLGAGKTTLLNHLLRDIKPSRVIVVENEFGQVPLDGSLLEKSYSELYEFSSGCICCSIGEELEQVLSDLVVKQVQADYLIIEATGVADPGNVGALFMQPEIQSYFTLDSAVCVVDAETIADRIEEVEEVRRQISFATEIVINKTGMVMPDYIAEVENILRALNPFARLHQTADGKIPAANLLHSNIFELPEIMANVRSGHQHHHHHHAHGDIQSVVWKTAKGVKKQELEHLLAVLLTLHAHQLYRIKGLVWFAGKANPTLVQSAGKYVSMVELPAENGQTQITELVFIGKNIQQESIERMLKPALEKEPDL
jgi:G3E family GTPase